MLVYVDFYTLMHFWLQSVYFRRHRDGVKNNKFSLLYSGSGSSSSCCCCCKGGGDGDGSVGSDEWISANSVVTSLNLAARTTASLERCSSCCWSSWIFCFMSFSLVTSNLFSSFCSSISTSGAADRSAWTYVGLTGSWSDETWWESGAAAAAASSLSDWR